MDRRLNKSAASLGVLWLAALVYRLAVDDAPGGFTDWFSAAIFWLLTFALMALALAGFVRYLQRRAREAPESGLWFDSEAVKFALIGSFVLGTIFRMTTWGGSGQSVIGWIGTGLCCLGLFGLLAFGYRRETRSAMPNARLSERPRVKYGVIALFIAAIAFQIAFKPGGALASIVAFLGVASFFVLLAYFVRWIWRRGRGRAVASH